MQILFSAKGSRSSATPMATGSDQGKRAWPLLGHILAAMLLCAPLAAQSPIVPPPATGAGISGQDESAPGVDARMQAKRIAQLNVIRQKAMVSDVEKLVHLAKELNDDASSGGTTLSPGERLHKAAEIEKLAKEVKEKMTYAVGTPTEIGGPFRPFSR